MSTPHPQTDVQALARKLTEADQPLEHFSPSEVEGRLQAWLNRMQAVGPDQPKLARRVSDLICPRNLGQIRKRRD